MNTAELKQAMKILCSNDDVPFVKGRPGAGKSDCVKQFAQSRAEDLGLEYYEGPEFYDADKFGFIDLRLNSIDVIDLSGLPMIDKEHEVTRFTRSPYIPADGHGILFLDELPQSKPSNMAAVSQLILDKRVGAHSLGKNWKIISAGNRTQDRASANRLPTHVANRLTQLELDFDLDQFVGFMLDEKVDDSAIAFAKFAPQHLESFKPENDVNCTPRSFVTASKYLSLAEELMYPLMAGTVGEGVTAEFIGFNKIYRNLPDFQEFLDKPTTVKLPEKADIMFATIQMLSHHAKADNIDRLSKYISRLSDTPERQVSFWMNALAMDVDIVTTPEYQKFAKENQSIIL